MLKRLTAIGLIATVLVLSQTASIAEIDFAEQTPKPMPEFTQRTASAWINSPPLSLADLRGKVVLLDFWTFDCWNCYNSIPWLKALEARYQRQGLQIVGIHSPEFEHEKNPANVRKKVAEFGLQHPIMLDNDFAFWRAMNNRYWPAFYLIDRQGRIRQLFVGETHAGDRRALAIEERVKALLAESSETASSPVK